MALINQNLYVPNSLPEPFRFTMHSLVQYGDDIYDVGTGLKYTPSNNVSAIQYYVENALSIALEPCSGGSVIWVDSSELPDVFSKFQVNPYY